MSKYIDLSHTIKNGMSKHPYDDQVKLTHHKFLDKDEFNDSKLETSMHVGTHIDLPGHLLNDDNTIDNISIDQFIGNGVLIDVREEELIMLKDDYKKTIKEGDIVLFFTGFDKKFEEEEYYLNYPIIDKELAEFLVSRNIKIVGMDLPSPDNYPFEIHKIFFKAGIYIIENMTNLDKLLDVKNFEVIALPLKIRAESSPIRVLARI